MALDTLPDDLNVFSRDQFRDLYLRSIQIRNPGASVKQDTQPWIDASAMADVLAPMSQNARLIGRSIPLSEVTGNRLDQRLNETGLPPRFPETGSQGAVKISASTTGATIPAGTLATDPNGLEYQCTTTNTYSDGSSVPMSAVDTGTQTNIDPGTVLIWSVGIPGLFQSCTVIEQTNGYGFSGGRGAESDDEVRLRISDAEANPAAAGNDAEYQKLMEDSLGHGIAVQKAFTYPAGIGTGTTCGAFTQKPATVGASRRPNTTQIAAVQSFVVGQMPGDDGYIPLLIAAQPTDIVMDVTWATGAASWVDAAPWPARYATGSGAIVVSAATSAISFTLATDDAVYSGVTAPVPGNNIAFFDQSQGGQFRQKRLLTVTGAGPWVCTVDTTNGASDTTYTPVIGQRCCPWSSSLQTLVSPIASYFGTLGPGEMYSTFFDPGIRQKRQPPSPKTWPNKITSKIEDGINALTSVGDFRIAEGLGVTTNVGAPGSFVYLIELAFISAFPL